MNCNFLIVDPEDSLDVLKAFASEVRVKVVKLLRIRGGVTVNEITAALFRLWLWKLCLRHIVQTACVKEPIP